MPWKEVSLMSLRWKFVTMASQPRVTMTELCRRYQISPQTGYKWLKRSAKEGPASLEDRSRRPHRSPDRSSFPLEQQVLEIRDQHPAWGARKSEARLEALGALSIPAASTIHAILRRHGRIDPAQAVKHQPWQRFEHEAPNQLWQMDFKGHFTLGNGQRCHPLTVLDDHSRFALGLEACHNQRGETVEARLVRIFRRYGLPERLLVDNGSPWGDDSEHPYTPLGLRPILPDGVWEVYFCAHKIAQVDLRTEPTR